MSFRKISGYKDNNLEKIEVIIDKEIINESITKIEEIINEEIINEEIMQEEIMQEEIINDLLFKINNLEKINENIIRENNKQNEERNILINDNKTEVSMMCIKHNEQIIELKEQTVEEIKLIKDTNETEVSMMCIKHNEQIIELKEQTDIYMKKNKEYENMKNEENEKHLIKYKKENEKTIIQRKIIDDQIKNTIKITNNIKDSLCNQINKFKEIILNDKFNDDRFEVVCLYVDDKDDTNKTLINNELSKIFQNIEYISYVNFHSKYVTRIISILKTLESFLNNDKKYLILFEYDFKWLFNTQVILEKLNSIKNNNFNLLLLNYNNFFVKYKSEENEYINMIGLNNNAYTINSFIINKLYASKLIKILEETIENIVKNNNNDKKLYENGFNKLLKDKKCYGIIPSLGKSRLIYNKEENMNCIIAIIDNNTSIKYNEIPYMYKVIKKSTYNFYHEDDIYLNEKEDIISEIIKYCYNEYKNLDYLFVLKNGYNYNKYEMIKLFKKIIKCDSNLILDKNSEDFFIKLKKENLDLINLNNKDFKIIDFKN